MSKIKPILWNQVPEGTEPVSVEDRILVFQKGVFRWLPKRFFKGDKGDTGDTGFDLESELQKFNAYPSQKNSYSNICNTTIQIINHSDYITAENGYSLAWQVYAPKKMRMSEEHWGKERPNFWCTITGHSSNYHQLKYLKFQDTFLSPVKGDLSSRLLIRDFHSVSIRIKSHGSTPTHYGKFKAGLEIKGLGRKIIKKYTKSKQGSDDINSFQYGKGTFNNFSVKIPLRLVLVASQKIQTGSSIYLENIRTVKVCWTGWGQINGISLNESGFVEQYVSIGI